MYPLKDKNILFYLRGGGGGVTYAVIFLNESERRQLSPINKTVSLPPS